MPLSPQRKRNILCCSTSERKVGSAGRDSFKREEERRGREKEERGEGEERAGEGRERREKEETQERRGEKRERERGGERSICVSPSQCWIELAMDKNLEM